MALLQPIAQPQAYHHFADQRTVAGIAHGFDVLSNLAFLVSGLLGLWFVFRAGLTLDAGTRWAFATLFFGLVLTSIGSTYYHLAPDNQRLVFDRMPMIIAMAGCLGSVVTDRFGGRTAWMITALLAIGLWTVQQWSAGEQGGPGRSALVCALSGADNCSSHFAAASVPITQWRYAGIRGCRSGQRRGQNL